MVKTEYKIGFIGSGLIAKKHLLVIKSNYKDIKIAGCLNPKFNHKNKENLNYLENIFGRLYCDLNEWLNSEKPDVVYICTPPFARFDYERELIKRGIHYFVEKPPLSSNQNDLVKLLEDKYQIVIKLGYQWRYLKFNNELIDLIRDDDIGYINILRFNGLPFQDWKLNHKLSFGNTYERLMHVTDYCEYIFNKNLNPISFTVGESKINNTIESNSNLPDAEVFVFKIGDAIGTMSSVSYSQSNDIFEITFVGKKYIYRISANTNKKIKLEVVSLNKVIKKYSDLTDELYVRESIDFIESVKNKDFSSTMTYLKSIETATRVLDTINNK